LWNFSGAEISLWSLTNTGETPVPAVACGTDVIAAHIVAQLPPTVLMSERNCMYSLERTYRFPSFEANSEYRHKWDPYNWRTIWIVYDVATSLATFELLVT
jgi:hypothetical protein